MEEKTPCETAIEKAGGPRNLARLLGGISSQAISQWKSVPAGRVLAVANITGMRPEQLRPDIFGMPQEAAE